MLRQKCRKTLRSLFRDSRSLFPFVKYLPLLTVSLKKGITCNKYLSFTVPDRQKKCGSAVCIKVTYTFEIDLARWLYRRCQRGLDFISSNRSPGGSNDSDDDDDDDEYTGDEIPPPP